MGVGGIAKAVEQMQHVLRYLSAPTSELSMVGTDGVEQQQGVPGRGGVQDDERVNQLSPCWSCSSSPSQLPTTRFFRMTLSAICSVQKVHHTHRRAEAFGTENPARDVSPSDHGHR